MPSGFATVFFTITDAEFPNYRPVFNDSGHPFSQEGLFAKGNINKHKMREMPYSRVWTIHFYENRIQIGRVAYTNACIARVLKYMDILSSFEFCSYEGGVIVWWRVGRPCSVTNVR